MSSSVDRFHVSVEYRLHMGEKKERLAEFFARQRKQKSRLNCSARFVWRHQNRQLTIELARNLFSTGYSYVYFFIPCHWLRYSNIRIIVLIVLWKAKFQMISLSRFLTYSSAQMLNLVRWNASLASQDRFNHIRITIFQELHADLWKWTFKNRFKKKTSSEPKWMNGTFNWEKK